MYMKHFQRICTLLFLGFIAFGCSSESVRPESGDKAVLGTTIPRPTVQCGPSIFTRMKDGNMDLGGVEILNTSNQLYVIMDLNPYKYVEEVKMYVGDISSIPLDNDGNISIEDFGCQAMLSVPVNSYTCTAPLSTTPSCQDVVIWARISTRSVFGNLVATNYAWMMGSQVANGQAVNYCAPSCATSGSTDDNVN
jgi:hypothetical protein